MNRMIELKNVYKTYYMGEVPTHALEDINLDIYEGEILVIVGPSGSGKTTMLNVISGLDNVTQGSIGYNGKNITKLSDRKKTKFRKDNLGFIFQTYNLLDHLNVYENVKVGSVLSKNKININEILITVGLEKHKYKEIYQLSGGEQQRVSIARAIAKNPKIMFCDEPTGALDEKTGKVVLESLVNINERFKTTTIIITHNPGIALIGDRIVRMNSGKIVKITKNKKRMKPKDIPWG